LVVAVAELGEVVVQVQGKQRWEVPVENLVLPPSREDLVITETQATLMQAAAALVVQLGEEGDLAVQCLFRVDIVH
jgi:hypothetical protein